ncbi:hypothetical protein AURDEDRAFT_161740 [Auricularia subglabra TFB-10046 SS5]|nr:hypothetical protein AURDEDRAFT_161740 [Auricularia subglabra TFB-10046 SS5]
MPKAKVSRGKNSGSPNKGNGQNARRPRAKHVDSSDDDKSDTTPPGPPSKFVQQAKANAGHLACIAAQNVWGETLLVKVHVPGRDALTLKAHAMNGATVPQEARGSMISIWHQHQKDWRNEVRAIKKVADADLAREIFAKDKAHIWLSDAGDASDVKAFCVIEPETEHLEGERSEDIVWLLHLYPDMEHDRDDLQIPLLDAAKEYSYQARIPKIVVSCAKRGSGGRKGKKGLCSNVWIDLLEQHGFILSDDTVEESHLARYEKMVPRGHLSLRYQNWVLHGPSPIDDDAIHLDVLDAIENANVDLIETIFAFLGCAAAVKFVRYLTVDNEWTRLWPWFVRNNRSLLRPNATNLYDSMYSALVSLIAAIRATHIRFVSVSLTHRVIDHLAAHPTLRALTLERYGVTCPAPSIFTPGSRKLHNIVFLGILLDFDRSVHRRHWGVLTLCPNLRQVHAYSDSYATVGFQFPMFPTASSRVQHLEYLHLQGCVGGLECLILWLAGFPSRSNQPGALRRLKLHSISPITHDDAFWLISVLGTHYPDIRVLVLEGVQRVQPFLFGHIRDSLPRIESLSVISRANESQMRNKLCQWDRPGYEYAEEIRGCWNLEHLEVNMLWYGKIEWTASERSGQLM